MSGLEEEILQNTKSLINSKAEEQHNQGCKLLEQAIESELLKPKAYPNNTK